MAPDGTLARAVAALTRHGGHNRESARTFLARCTPDEARAIAAAGTATEYDEAVEHVLDRQERNDLTRGTKT
jgi:hypothetical protein